MWKKKPTNRWKIKKKENLKEMASKRINKKKMTEMATEAVAMTEKAARNAAERVTNAAQAAVENIEEQVSSANTAADAKEAGKPSKVAEVLSSVMNKPEVVEAKEEISENIAEAKKQVKSAVKTARTKVLDTCVEFDGNSVSLTEVEKAVKKDAAEKGLKGEILIYLNINEQAAYYTVNGEGADTQKVRFDEI